MREGKVREEGKAVVVGGVGEVRCYCITHLLRILHRLERILLTHRQALVNAPQALIRLSTVIKPSIAACARSIGAHRL